MTFEEWISDPELLLDRGHERAVAHMAWNACHLSLLGEIEKEVLALADVPRSTAYRGGLRDCILIIRKKKEELK